MNGMALDVVKSVDSIVCYRMAKKLTEYMLFNYLICSSVGEGVTHNNSI